VLWRAKTRTLRYRGEQTQRVQFNVGNRRRGGTVAGTKDSQQNIPGELEWGRNGTTMSDFLGRANEKEATEEKTRGVSGKKDLLL